MSTDEQRELADAARRAGSVFTPTSPIDERSLFAGRDEQVRLILDVINQKGQHAMLYGERGVGKTSLANVLASFLDVPNQAILAPRVNCDSTDSFESVWRKVFDEITLKRSVRRVGFGKAPEQLPLSFNETVGTGPLSPDSVRRALTMLSQFALPILIIDEFDRLPPEPRRSFADTVKSLSDHAVAATVILVGVADSVEQLIDEHKSVERALVQIRMPRMSSAEIETVITTGATRLGMSAAKSAAKRVAKLAQGLPHYAHLIGLYASRVTLDSGRREIGNSDVDAGVKRAMDGTQQSIRSAYDYAIRSPRKDSLFADVLLACAMAETNELGFFAAQDIREPMQRITGKRYEIPSFAQHLNEFCEEKRGPILGKDGTRRRFRYRFIDPLLQPFVIMKGLNGGRIEASALEGRK